MAAMLRRGIHQFKSIQGVFSGLSQHSRSLSSAHAIRSSVKDVGTSKPLRSGKKSLVIFDKDGTLICIHTMWNPWRKKIIENLEEHSGLKIEKLFDKRFGYCSKTEKLQPGLLAEGTHECLQEGVIKLLVELGKDKEGAKDIVQRSWITGDDGCNPAGVKSLDNLHTLFQTLCDNDIKIAICTSDSRHSTMSTIKKLGIEHYLDKIVCGDDATSLPKPSPHNALMICDALKIHPAEAVVVGDSLSDMHMGKEAKLGASIAVSTGASPSDLLEPHSDHVVERLRDILPIVVPEGNKIHSASKTKASLVIFDSHGTLLDFQYAWVPLVKELAESLESRCGMSIKSDVFSLLGFDASTQKVIHGVLADGTQNEAKEKLTELLIIKGVERCEAREMVEESWEKLSMDHKSVDDISVIFKTLKHYDIQIAICTTDTREWTQKALDQYGVSQYVDKIVCGDDMYSRPKPSPFNVERICRDLEVNVKDAVIVGDTVADVGMGRLAKIGKTIGVLSGLGTAEDLKKHADLVIPSVKHVLPILLPEGHRNVVTDITREQNRSLSATQNKLLNAFTPIFKGPQIRTSPPRSYSTSSQSIPTYDYVIVGAGSAGCVLANRLSADPNNSVILMEAGPKDYTWKIQMPAALMYNLADDKYNWCYHTVPQKHLNNRVMYWPRGRVWGGSSSLNAMVYIRGHAYDYDNWEKLGARGWSYADCLPYFRKSQTHELGPDDYRGGDGPLYVSRGITDNPLHSAYIEAGQQAGYPVTDDMNGYQQEGFGRMDMTIKKGKRCNTAVGYLHPVLQRNNLTTETRALTSKILFEGKRAVGIEYEQNGQTKQIRAAKEVILSGGAINSPQLLMLSGIGNADDLKKHNISTVAHLPGVGENLQEHLDLYIQYECTQPVTLYKAQWKFPHNMIIIGLQWFLTHTGDGATTHLESGSFIRSQPGVEHPDIQYHFLPSVVIDHGQSTGHCHAFQVHASPMRPTSYGTIKLQSNNPNEHPIIDANYLATEEDRRVMRDSVKLARDVFAQKAFDPFRGNEIWPGKDIQSDRDIDAVIRDKTDSAYHPSCTCKMGSESDPMAVVDPETRVIGVEGLRVVDASIMPQVISGNLNGPTVMLAEKAADIILGNTPLPKSTAPVWRPKTLETQHGH